MSSTECSTTIADKKYYSSENDPIHLDPIVHWLERAPDEIVAMAMRRSGYEDVAEEIP